MKEFAVIGLGRFGVSLAERLIDLGHNVLAIDVSAEKVQDASEIIDHAVVADATDEDDLRALGMRNFDVVVVAIGENIQASILCTVLLKELDVKTVITKAVSDLHGKVLERVGADKVVFPERDMGQKLAYSLSASNVIDYMVLSNEYGIEEIRIPKKLCGITLEKLKLRAKYGLNIIGIKKENGTYIHNVGADTVFEVNDIAIVAGSYKGLRIMEEE